MRADVKRQTVRHCVAIVVGHANIEPEQRRQIKPSFAHRRVGLKLIRCQRAEQICVADDRAAAGIHKLRVHAESDVGRTEALHA